MIIKLSQESYNYELGIAERRKSEKTLPIIISEIDGQGGG